jgi:hypothetical protein
VKLLLEKLDSIADQHPLATGFFGVASGIGPAIAKALHLVAGVAADVGVICGAATAIVTLCIAVRTWRRGQREEAAARNFVARHREEPWEDHLP